jgi:hypothetical protein
MRSYKPLAAKLEGRIPCDIYGAARSRTPLHATQATQRSGPITFEIFSDVSPLTTTNASRDMVGEF